MANARTSRSATRKYSFDRCKPVYIPFFPSLLEHFIGKNPSLREHALRETMIFFSPLFPLPPSWPLTFLNSALSIARISYYLCKEIQFEILGKRGKNISRWMENNLGELVFIRGIRNENFERRNFFSLFLHFVSDPCIIYCVGENKWKDCAWKKNIGYLFTKQFKFR